MVNENKNYCASKTIGLMCLIFKIIDVLKESRVASTLIISKLKVHLEISTISAAPLFLQRPAYTNSDSNLIFPL